MGLLKKFLTSKNVRQPTSEEVGQKNKQEINCMIGKRSLPGVELVAVICSYGYHPCKNENKPDFVTCKARSY